MLVKILAIVMFFLGVLAIDMRIRYIGFFNGLAAFFVLTTATVLLLSYEKKRV